MSDPIYKIAEQDVWDTARDAGEMVGTAVDLADGYIHFSTAAQLRETLYRHYAGRTGLMLATIDADALGDALVWEPSRGGQLFPHLYAPLPMTAVISARTLSARADGGFDLPEIAS